MQKYFSCKGSCLASIGADQPAEVVDDAPNDLVHYISCRFSVVSLCSSYFTGKQTLSIDTSIYLT